jgi:hypothetical protein
VGQAGSLRGTGSPALTAAQRDAADAGNAGVFDDKPETLGVEKDFGALIRSMTS